MSTLFLAATLLLLINFGYIYGRRYAFSTGNRVGGVSKLHSRPTYHGLLVALWCGLPTFLLLLAWQVIEPSVITSMVVSSLPDKYSSLPPERLGLVLNDIKNLAQGLNFGSTVDPELIEASRYYQQLHQTGNNIQSAAVLVLAVIGIFIGIRLFNPALRARNHVERIVRYFLIFCSLIAIFTTIGIVLSVLFEAIRFFQKIPVTEFLFGLNWSPQTSIRADQVGASGEFGAIPVFGGTMLISAIAMMVAAPIGLLSAIYLSEYASKRMRAIAKPLIEILAGVPTVVYGFFAALVVAPLIREAGTAVGLQVSSESALAAGLIMGIMIIPFVMSISDDVINAVPQELRDGSYGLGATKSETVKNVVIPAALPGIVGGILLAVSRAIGETMIVVMAAGLSANLTANPLQAVTTVTVQIVTLLVGDQEFDSPKTLAAFALGLLLFIVTLILNVIALYIVRKYREEYE
ncbi:MAG: phosphate ABC transporter permease subunit PstC [Thermodesulfobacteriota bacterium]|nr:phosphate ABC transporter permease subunit PstC [Thermodesulfobacteriota bacterium]